ncbi:UNVERIFIED_ORG: hypothetical protein FHR35_006401 [Microbispora rosea subsp. rosea]
MNDFADLVRIHRHGRGTSIRIHFDLPGKRAASTC